MDVTFRESEPFYKKNVELNSQLEKHSPSTVSTMREEEERTIKEKTVITGEISLERHEDSCTPENSNQGEVRVPENQGEQLPHEELRAPVQGELRVYQRRQRRQVSEVQQNQSEKQRSTQNPSTQNPMIPNAYVPGPTSSSSSPVPTPSSESSE